MNLFYCDVDNDLNKVPNDICIMTFGLSRGICPVFLQKYNDPTYFQKRAILTPKYEMVHALDDTIMQMISSEGRT